MEKEKRKFNSCTKNILKQANCIQYYICDSHPPGKLTRQPNTWKK